MSVADIKTRLFAFLLINQQTCRLQSDTGMDERNEAIDGLAFHFLVTQTTEHSLENLRPYARKLFEKCESSLLSLDFQCQMLAEVFVPKCNQLDVVYFDVVDLCESFCRKRISKCHEENDDQSQQTFMALQFFKAMAMKQVFPTHPSLWKDKIFSENQVSEFELAGLTSSSEFIDVSLAHYFAALAILDVLQQEELPVVFDFFIFSTLLYDQSGQLRSIRTFLDHLVTKRNGKVTPHPISERWHNNLVNCYQLCEAESNMGLGYYLIDCIRVTSLERPYDSRFMEIFVQLCTVYYSLQSN